MRKVRFFKILAVLMAATVFLAACGGEKTPQRGEDIDSAGLVGYWDFNEQKDGKFEDLSGSGRDLSVVGTSQLADGKDGRAFRFDGRTVLTFSGDKYIQSYDMTFSFFIRVEDFNPPPAGVSTPLGWANEIISIENSLASMFTPYLVSSNLYWDPAKPSDVAITAKIGGSAGAMIASDNYQVSPTEDFNIYNRKNQWIHITIVIEDYVEETGEGYLRVYVNGELETTDKSKKRETELAFSAGSEKILGNTDPAYFDLTRIAFGGYINDDGEVERGGLFRLDELRIYTRAVSGDEAMKLAKLFG